jgi:hypothetical protein
MLFLAQAVSAEPVWQQWGPMGGLAAVVLSFQVAWFKLTAAQQSKPLKELLAFLREQQAILHHGMSMLTDLHDWHKPDSAGEQGWKGARVAEAVQNNTEVLRKLVPILDRLIPLLERLEQQERSEK